MVMIRTDIEEDPKATMTQFLRGVNEEITNTLKLQHYLELDDMTHMAMEI